MSATNLKKRTLRRAAIGLFAVTLLIAGFVAYIALHVDSVANLKASTSGPECSNSSYVLEGTASNLDHRGTLPTYDLTDKTGTVNIRIRDGSNAPKAGVKIRVFAAVVCDGSGVTARGTIAEIRRVEISN